MGTRIGGCIQTYTGLAFYPADPRPEDVDIRDIAHALSNACRWGGHCSRFFSVAEHSVNVSMLVEPEHALQALLHDATEAYVVDVPRPLKKMLGDVYATLEKRVWDAICARYGMPCELHESVKKADDDALLAERNALLGVPHVEVWGENSCVMDGAFAARISVVGVTPVSAEKHFLRRFIELTGGQQL